MDKERIEDIFKKWQGKAMLTRKGALRVEPFAVFWLKIALVLALWFILVCLAVVFFFVVVKWLNGYNQTLAMILSILFCLGGPFLFLLFKQRDSLFRYFYKIEGIPNFFIELLFFPFLKPNPILLFFKDRLVTSSGLFGRKGNHDYSDIEKVSAFFNKKDIALKIMFKESNKTFKVSGTPALDYLLHLFGSAFQPIFVNEPLCEDMLRLFADMITLGSDPQSQQDGLQCAKKYFSEPKYKDYDYARKLTELVDTFNHYRAQRRMPRSEDYINRCLSILKNRGVDYDGRLALLSHLFECAYASEEMVDVVELDRLSRIAYYFRIKEWDFLSLKYSFEAMKQQGGRRNGTENAQQRERYQSAYSNRLKEAYKILGLNEKATLEEVKSAYRTQVKNCHPDTLPPTAKDKEREEASIRFRTVTEAYDFLCEELVVEPVSVTK
jgi:DnaJ-class molecular chaperone with C-terminal Zn finger domain